MKNRGGLFSLSNTGALRMWAMASLFWVTAGTPAFAQFLGLGVTTPANSISVGSPVMFTINLTNEAGISTVLVTNSISGTSAFQIMGATTTRGSIVTNSSSVLFSLGTAFDAAGALAQLTVTVRPMTAGTFTNRVVTVSASTTNTPATNLIIQVIPPVSDLAVSIRPPAAPILVNDQIHFSTTITNLGTNTVTNVLLTNGGFGGMKLFSVAPTNQSYTLTNGLLILNAGTFTNRAGKTFTFFTQPTNAGALTLTAAISATNITEANLSNNIASANITVEPFTTNDLVAVNASAMTLNRQTLLMEQRVNLSNVGTSAVAAARVIVSGLTNRLFNAVGTNNGNPYVVYNAPLEPGAEVSLLMEYSVPSRQPIIVQNSDYMAVAVPAADLSAGAVGVPVTLITNLGAAGILIEFPAITNRSYSIFYSSNAAFTDGLMAQPAIVAPAPSTQWIDNGPPKTISHPSSAGSRFYRVLLNP